MNLSPLPGEVLAAAENRAARAKEEFDAALERARRVRTTTDWLRDRPDLVRVDRIIKELPLRQAKLDQASYEFQKAFAERLGDLLKNCPFTAPPDLEVKIALFRRVLEVLKACDSDASLVPLPNEVNLDPTLRAALDERTTSIIRARRRADFEDCYKGSKWHRFYKKELEDATRRRELRLRKDLEDLEYKRSKLKSEHTRSLHSRVEAELSAMKALSDTAQADLSEAKAAQVRQAEIIQLITPRIEAYVTEQTCDQRTELDAANSASQQACRDCIEQFQLRLLQNYLTVRIEDFLPFADHPLRQQLQDAKNNFIREIEEAQERDWWKSLAIHPISQVVEKLHELPKALIETVLDCLLELPSNYPHILNDEIHSFLQRQHHLLAQCAGVAAPVVVAYIGRIIGGDDYSNARELLNLFPTDDRSDFADVVAYLRFVVSETPELGGVTYYETLSEEDIFLGACYYGDEGRASPTLNMQSQWEYASLERALLSAKTGNDPHYLHSFKSGGLQPRIAELAFHRVYSQIHRGTTQNKLRDLNLERLQDFPSPWTLDLRNQLPPADWEDVNTQSYDVKSNPFYRTEREKLGLRGFLIKLKRYSDTKCIFPGILFTEAENEYCQWVYIGEYQPTGSSEPTEIRVLPFNFRLPKSERCILPSPECDIRVGMNLLYNRRLRIGWQLATGKQFTSEQRSSHDLLDKFADRCVQLMAGNFLEYASWKALTETTLEACNERGRESVQSFLKLADKLISDRSFPIRLPRINNTPILCRWIKDILLPLNENWYQIRCTECGKSASNPGNIELSNLRMTSEGTIYGMMKCNRCGGVRNEATILTHCYKCNSYPLIIGKNEVCHLCGGLICKGADQESCKCCKKTCRNNQQSTNE